MGFQQKQIIDVFVSMQIGLGLLVDLYVAVVLKTFLSISFKMVDLHGGIFVCTIAWSPNGSINNVNKRLRLVT